MKNRYVILTRFNLQYKESTQNLSIEWLEERIQLFQTYTLPSIKAQKNQNFEWLILIDARTPDSIYQRLQQIATSYRAIQLVQVNACGDEALMEYYRQMAHQLGAGYDLLISTRLDSDDCLAEDFTDAITKNITLQTAPYAISFPIGLQYFSQQKWNFRITYPSNHFLTIFEPGDAAQSALSYDHTRMSNYMPLIMTQETQPMWTEIVHGGNIANNYSPTYKPKMEPRSLKNVGGLITLHLRYRIGQVIKVLSHPKKVIDRIFSPRT